MFGVPNFKKHNRIQNQLSCSRSTAESLQHGHFRHNSRSQARGIQSYDPYGYDDCDAYNGNDSNGYDGYG